MARRWFERAFSGTSTRDGGLAALALALATGGMLLVRGHLGVLNALLLYFIVVFGASWLLALRPGPAAAVGLASFLLLDFFFIPPYNTLTIAESDHVLALFAYLGVALATANLAARVRAEAEAARREQRRTNLLYELNAALIGDVSLDAILATIVERVVHVYGAKRCRILLPDETTGLTVRASFPGGKNDALGRQALAVAEWALANRAPALLGGGQTRIKAPHGLNAPPPARAPRGEPDALYVPIATSRRAVGVLDVQGRPGGGRFREEDEALLLSFANQAALALERARLSEEAARAATLAESDELKSALLAAVSHDLRTPLAVIKASATSLLDPSVRWSEMERTAFLEGIDQEADRLTLMVGNLLDLSRIEGGVLKPDRDWCDAGELVHDAVARLTTRATDTGHQIRVELPPDPPLVYVDFVEIAQVLMNLGENAFKYTPAGSTVVFSVRTLPGNVEFAVTDNGPGIPAKELERIFEPFQRGSRHQRLPGSGIGLAIGKGLIAAHGGRIWAENVPGGGAAFRFTIPGEEPAA